MGPGYNFLLGVTSTETIGSGHDPGREGQLPPKLLSHFPFRALDLPGISFSLSFVGPDTYSPPPTPPSPAPGFGLVQEQWLQQAQVWAGHSLVCGGDTEEKGTVEAVPEEGHPRLSSTTQGRQAG